MAVAAMAVPPPEKQERTGFWDQPVTRSAAPGKNYTRFVRGMRIFLPLVAVSVIGMVMAWPRVQNTMAPIKQEAAEAAKPAVGKNELMNPTFNGVDERNEPYTVSAAHAVQSLNDRDVILLDHPTGEIVLTDGHKVDGKAAKGTYAQKDGRLMLEGDVTLHDDEGYVFTTSKILLNGHTHEAWSDQPVQGNGPAGTLAASGMQGYSDKKILIFTGPAKLVLNHVKGL